MARPPAPTPPSDRDKLCLLWYVKDSLWGVWRALPAVSGPVKPKELTTAQTPPESAVIRRSY